MVFCVYLWDLCLCAVFIFVCGPYCTRFNFIGFKTHLSASRSLLSDNDVTSSISAAEEMQELNGTAMVGQCSVISNVKLRFPTNSTISDLRTV